MSWHSFVQQLLGNFALHVFPSFKIEPRQLCYIDFVLKKSFFKVVLRICASTIATFNGLGWRELDQLARNAVALSHVDRVTDFAALFRRRRRRQRTMSFRVHLSSRDVMPDCFTTMCTYVRTYVRNLSSANRTLPGRPCRNYALCQKE